jgi:hypothetical protein
VTCHCCRHLTDFWSALDELVETGFDAADVALPEKPLGTMDRIELGTLRIDLEDAGSPDVDRDCRIEASSCTQKSISPFSAPAATLAHVAPPWRSGNGRHAGTGSTTQNFASGRDEYGFAVPNRSPMLMSVRGVMSAQRS